MLNQVVALSNIPNTSDNTGTLLGVMGFLLVVSAIAIVAYFVWTKTRK